jgi:hypothetical protein
MRYVLDEDVNPEVAIMARGPGLDVMSVHVAGRRGLSDPDQLEFAVSGERVLITRNRDDFLRLARAAFAPGQTRAGILIIPATAPNRDGPRMAHALKRWDDPHPRNTPTGFVDFLH